MDMIELGRRIRLARIEGLKMNQQELAEALGSYQALISRLEKGIGGSIELLLDIVGLLHKKKLNGAALFTNTFSIEQLTEKYTPGKLNATDKVAAEKFSVLKETIEMGYEQVMEMRGLFDIKPIVKQSTKQKVTNKKKNIR